MVTTEVYEALDRTQNRNIASEDCWDAISEDRAMALAKQAADTAIQLGRRDAAEEYAWEKLQKRMRFGNVVNLPAGFIRRRTNLPKCPCCGSSILPMTGTVSVRDKHTRVCQRCAEAEKTV